VLAAVLLILADGRRFLVHFVPYSAKLHAFFAVLSAVPAADGGGGTYFVGVSRVWVEDPRTRPSFSPTFGIDLYTVDGTHYTQGIPAIYFPYQIKKRRSHCPFDEVQTRGEVGYQSHYARSIIISYSCKPISLTGSSLQPIAYTYTVHIRPVFTSPHTVR